MYRKQHKTNHTTQHYTTQHNPTQPNTTQYNTIQYNTIQYNTIQSRRLTFHIKKIILYAKLLINYQKSKEVL